MRYVGCCIDLNGDDVSEMVEKSKEITYRAFMRNVGAALVAEMPPFNGYDWRMRPKELTLKNDWHVSYHRSKWEGRPCFYICWSAIEYIFQEAS